MILLLTSSIERDDISSPTIRLIGLGWSVANSRGDQIVESLLIIYIFICNSLREIVKARIYL